MKKQTLLLALVLIPLLANAQVGFKQLVDAINWQGSETELIGKYKNNIKKTKHEEWPDEKSCSDYTLFNIKLGDFTINNAPVRVNNSSQKIYRINFFVYEDSKDVNLSKTVDNLLISLFGTPISIEDDEGIGIISSYHKEWITDKYKIRSNLFVFGSETYTYTISVEPIEYYPVSHQNVTVLQNGYSIVVPKIVSFKVDEDKNVYIKKEGGIEVKKSYKKDYDTPKGLVIVFDGGMFCYRALDNDIAYIQDNFAATYPIVK